MSQNASESQADCKYTPDIPREEKAKTGIKKAAQKYGEPLSRSKYTQWRRTEPDSYYPPAERIETDLYNSWNDACSEAGVDSTQGNRYTKEEYLDAIREAASECGEPLTAEKYNSWRQKQNKDTPCRVLYNTRQDIPASSWNEVCELVGVETKQTTYSESYLLGAINAAANDMGEPLTKHKYSTWRENADQDYPHVGTISTSDIGPWTNACDKADVSCGEQYISNKKYTVADMKDHITSAANECGQPLTVPKYKRWRKTQTQDKASITTIITKLEKPWSEICASLNIETGND